MQTVIIVYESASPGRGELHVSTRRMFDAAGFAEVSRPSKRRVVMRIDF